MSSTEFKQKIIDAISNPTLTGALGRFSVAYRTARAKAYEETDFEAIREQIATIKSASADHFDEVADRFQQAAEARGRGSFALPTRRR